MAAAERTTETLLDAALAAARSGCHILPLHWIKPNGACSCGETECSSPGKHPRTKNGLNDATDNPIQIEKWWRRWPKANVGMRTGAISGVLVVDVDCADGAVGEQSFEELATTHGSWPETLQGLTGRDGMHVVFRHPRGGVVLPNSTSKIALNIDIRGDGGYIVIPPSVTEQQYQWLNQGTRLADPPAWLVEAITKPERPAAAPRPQPTAPLADVGGITPYARVALDAHATELAGMAPNSGRNHRLNQAAFRMSQLIAGGQIDERTVVDTLTAAARRCGLTEVEIPATIRSGLTSGAREPQYPDPTRTSSRPGAVNSSTPRIVHDQHEEPPVEDEPPPSSNSFHSGEPPAPPAEFVDEPPPPSGRPTVQVNARQLRDITGDFHRAIVDANVPPVVYARAGALARVRRDEKGSPVVDTIGETVLRHRVARVCNCVRVTKEGDQTAVPPPLDAIRDLAASADWSDLPPLEAVTEIPTLRPDGTIHDQAGYDRSTRLLYVPVDGVTIPDVASEPDAEALAGALAVIDELLCDFRFGTDTDRANAIGMLLTPLVRPAIVNAQVPLALLDAPEPGTGKGLLADLVSLIATGRDTAVKSLPKTEEEIRKTITATLIEGHTIVVLDNIEDAIRSSALAAALTASTWSDRILGRSETVTVPNRATWIATGNNLQVAGDLARRCYHIRLDARQARPWERTDFRHPDLRAWTRENRGRLLWALLTLARAWWVAGQPPADVPILGGFTPWAQTIGGILAHAGLGGFLSNIFEFMATNDTEANEWETFLAAWYDRLGTEITTVARLKVELTSIGDVPMRDALPSKLVDVLERPSFTKVLGNQLRSHAGRHYGTEGYRLIRQTNDLHSKVVRWSVERSQEEPAEAANVLPIRGVAVSRGFGLNEGSAPFGEQKELLEETHIAVGETKPAERRNPASGQNDTLIGTCKRCGDPAHDNQLCGRCRHEDQTF